MPDLETIRKIAHKALVLQTADADSDNWLWDRAKRCQKNIDKICRLPELADQANSIDRLCLVAATYFADSGFLQYSRGLKGGVKGMLAEVNYTKLCTFSTQIVSEKLARVLTPERIDKVNEIITESCNRFTESVEAMILSDARNLEDLGAVGRLNEVFRQMNSGKGVSEIVTSWKRKIEYGYWQARLKEGFRFEAVGRVAQQRFQAAERFMEQLITENQADDLEDQLRQMPK
jgi:hypothetical protein